ncbi:MAG: hypothetical protein ACE368_10970 [Paracoccaceae bacterium]
MRLANGIKGLQRAQTIARSLWLVLALCLTPLPAAAVNVTVGGVTDDISYTDTSYDPSTALLEGQPWWGDPTLADNIITQYLSDGGNLGPALVLFAVEPSALDPTGSIVVSEIFLNSGPTSYDFLNNVSVFYAIALSVTPVAAVPEIDGNALAKALFILFALGAWLHTRRRRLG